MSRQSQTSRRRVAPRAGVEPPEVRWIPRMLQEIEAPFGEQDPAGQATIEKEEEGLLALAQMATQPLALISAQLAMLNLAVANLGSLQADWIEAWGQLLTGPSLLEAWLEPWRAWVSARPLQIA